MRIAAILLIVAAGLGLTGCGGDLEDTGTLTVNILGDGIGEVTGTGIQCPGTCEREVLFSRAQINSIDNDAIILNVDIAVDNNSEMLGWLATGRAYYSSELDCESGLSCAVPMQEICFFRNWPLNACGQNQVQNVELRPVVMNKNTLIDWDRSSRTLCVLKQPGEAQCWEDYMESSRSLERVAPPVLVNPTQISTSGSHACALDQTGVHCWARQGNEIVTEPSVQFGLRNIEQIAVRSSDYGCARGENTVTCWQGTELARVPDLVAPINLVRKNVLICVDDGDEEVCWGAVNLGGGNFEYVEYRTPLDAVLAGN